MRSSSRNDSIRYSVVSTKKEISELRIQIDALHQQTSDWRRQLAWQEEIAFFALKAEELTRRLNALEKRIAQEIDGERVTIRFRAQRYAEIEGGPPGPRVWFGSQGRPGFPA